MDNQKSGNQLNMALDLPDRIREQTTDLNVGYIPEAKSWELIVKYSGSLARVKEELKISVTELMKDYAILIVPEPLIGRLSDYEEIEYIEKPKRLYFSVNNGIAASCIKPLQTALYNLTGEGVIVGVIDSGIDFSHLDFRNEDNTSRILYLWDQTIPGNPPQGYELGSLYTKEDIDAALATRDMGERIMLVPSVDISGHGTHVAGIACGNGRASNGRYRGVAYQSDIIVVKLGSSVGGSFPKTSQLMEAVDFVIKMAIKENKPVAINISFGNNYGSHDGSSLLESFMNDTSNLGKTNIIVGTGNEGAAGHHTSGILTEGIVTEVPIAVGEGESTLNLQIWKNFYDEFEVEIESPEGIRVGPIPRVLGLQNFVIGGTRIYLYYGEPTPYSTAQEIYFEMLPIRESITTGIWRIRLYPGKIVTGQYDMWLPTSEALSADTRFLNPTLETTLTIPSTAYRVISVAAYDSSNDSLAYFSGRGYTRLDSFVKPDIIAPGVNIMSASPGGGYTSKSGTSMATPFVTGSVALLMQWGIVQGNDPFLYGHDCEIIGLYQRKPRKYGGSAGLVQFYFVRNGKDVT